jgi:hypothetical protein
MPGLVPAIHDFDLSVPLQVVEARHKAEHDEERPLIA